MEKINEKDSLVTDEDCRKLKGQYDKQLKENVIFPNSILGLNDKALGALKNRIRIV